MCEQVLTDKEIDILLTALSTEKSDTMSGTSKEATHYQESAMQPLQVCQALMTHEQFEGFLIGNIIKYRMRAKYKGKYEEDLQKANQYQYWLRLVRQGKVINPIEDTLPIDYTYGGI